MEYKLWYIYVYAVLMMLAGWEEIIDEDEWDKVGDKKKVSKLQIT